MKHAFVLLALLPALLFACGGSSDRGTGDADAYASQDATVPSNATNSPCSSDSDCGTGSACSMSAGVCVALPPQVQSFSVSVSPPSSSGLIGDQFTGLAIDTSGLLDLSLAAPVVLSGTVFHSAEGGYWTGAGNAPEAPASTADIAAGILVAVADGRIPGTQFRSETSVAAFDAMNPDAPRFSLEILPNVAYQATFIPGKGEFESLPPFTFPLLAGSSGAMNVALPPLDAYVRLQGMVRVGGESGVPVPGAQVAGQVGDSLIGTTTLTDDQGVFSLILPPGSGSASITVSSGRDSIPFPTRRFTWDDGLDALKAEYMASPFLTLDVDPVPAVRAVSIQVFGGEGFGTTVPMARVTAVGQAGGGEFKVSTTTDAAGVATLDLLEGTYLLAVTPPSASPWASTERPLDLLTQGSQAFLVRLDPRIGVSGTVVRGSTGTAVAGAVVTFLTDRSATVGATVSVGPSEATFTATTAADGSFTTAIDPGTYAMTVLPPAATGLPRVAYPSLDLSVAQALSVPLPEGALVRGHVRSAQDGLPVASASIGLFYPVSKTDAAGIWSLGDTSFASTLQTAAEGVTGVDGAFDLVVPVLSAGFSGLEPSGKEDMGTSGPSSLFGLPDVSMQAVD